MDTISNPGRTFLEGFQSESKTRIKFHDSGENIDLWFSLIMISIKRVRGTISDVGVTLD